MQKMRPTLKTKKKIKFALYLFFIFVIIYFNAPKLFDFSVESIKNNLKINNNINISNISEVKYKIFPTPRLKILSNRFAIGEENIEVGNSEIEIILNIGQIYNFKSINYKKLFINKGTTKINLNNFNQLLLEIKKNKKKLIFRKNNIIFFKKNKPIFKISDATVKVIQIKRGEELIINGNFLNNKIYIKLNSSPERKNNLILEIPELDIATRIFFEEINSSTINGFLNLEVFNNILKFNFTKKNNIKLKNGFVRSKLINSAVEGEITLNPNFFLKLDFETSNLNVKKLFLIVQEKFFSSSFNNLYLIKKINSIFNFKSKFQGQITNINGEILFENFKIGKDKDLYFNAKIIEFGKKGKIKFTLIKTIQYKKDLSKKIEILGIIFPSSSRVVFESILLDGSELSEKKIKEYENKFKDELIQDSMTNIFNESKIDKYLKNLF